MLHHVVVAVVMTVVVASTNLKRGFHNLGLSLGFESGESSASGGLLRMTPTWMPKIISAERSSVATSDWGPQEASVASRSEGTSENERRRMVGKPFRGRPCCRAAEIGINLVSVRNNPQKALHRRLPGRLRFLGPDQGNADRATSRLEPAP